MRVKTAAPIILLFALAASAIIFAIRSESSKNSPPTFGQVAPFHLTSQDGTSISLESLNGKIWVANFIFTRCQGPCPIMSQKMRQLQTIYEDQAHIQFVSVSVDPENDTPKKLREYAAKMNAKAPQWSFLTGARKDIVQLARSMMLESGDKDPNLHSTRFIVVDQQGKIRAIPDGRDDGIILALRETIDSLIKEDLYAK